MRIRCRLPDADRQGIGLLRRLWAFGLRLLTPTLLFHLRLGAAADGEFQFLTCFRFTLAFQPDQFTALLLAALVRLSLLLGLDGATLILGQGE
jgi:hypothetical protein